MKIYEHGQLCHSSSKGWWFYSEQQGEVKRLNVSPKNTPIVEVLNDMSLYYGWNFVSQEGRVYWLRRRVRE